MKPSEIVQQILNLVESSLEDARIPTAIAAHADKRVGKLITKTDADQLEAQLAVPIRIRRDYGWTYIAWGIGTPPNVWHREQSIRLANTAANARWPSGDKLRAAEPAYFDALDARNTYRAQLLTEHRQLDRLPEINPSKIERAATCIAKLQAAREALERLLADDQPLHVIRFEVEKLAEKP